MWYSMVAMNNIETDPFKEIDVFGSEEPVDEQYLALFMVTCENNRDFTLISYDEALDRGRTHEEAYKLSLPQQ